MTVSAYGIRVARDAFPNYTPQRIYMPLHSKIYEDRGKMFPVLIIDEAHQAKNPDSLLSKAIQNLRYHHAFLLTATPIHKSWNDLGGMILLLPGSPFKSFKHFQRVFPMPPPARNEVGRKGLREPFSTVLIELLNGMILARPKSVPDLQSCEQSIPLAEKDADTTHPLDQEFRRSDSDEHVSQPLPTHEELHKAIEDCNAQWKASGVTPYLGNTGLRSKEPLMQRGESEEANNSNEDNGDSDNDNHSDGMDLDA